MGYHWITWLADALRAEGCKVQEESGWKNRGRPTSTGQFEPYAAGVHHTASTSSSSNPHPTLKMCINGRSDLPGPLAHVVICYDGTCHVIAAGRANHAGESNGNGPLYSGDGNEQMVGFEVDYNGTQNMSSAQYDATIRASAAVVRHFQNDHSFTRGHEEWSTTGKWDPGGYSMDSIRADVKARLAGAAGGGDDDMPEYLSLSGPAMTAREGEWTAVKFASESSDQGDVHPDGYAWLNLEGAKYHAQVRLNDCQRPTPDATVLVRWAEYDKESGEFSSSPSPMEHLLSTGGTGVHDDVIDMCTGGHRVRAEVLSRGGDVSIASVGLTAIYWR